MSRNGIFGEKEYECINVTSREGRVSRNVKGATDAGNVKRHVPRGACE